MSSALATRPGVRSLKIRLIIPHPSLEVRQGKQISVWRRVFGKRATCGWKELLFFTKPFLGRGLIIENADVQPAALRHGFKKPAQSDGPLDIDDRHLFDTLAVQFLQHFPDQIGDIRKPEGAR